MVEDTANGASVDLPAGAAKKPHRIGTSGRARSWARRLAVQALYQWQVGGQDLGIIDAQFLTEQDISRGDIAYFQELLHHTPGRLDKINDALQPHINRPMEQIDPVEKAILWVGCYELLFKLEIPYRVALNEAVELAKSFGAEQSHKFINGVLDKTAQHVRTAEIGARRKS